MLEKTIYAWITLDGGGGDRANIVEIVNSLWTSIPFVEKLKIIHNLRSTLRNIHHFNALRWFIWTIHTHASNMHVAASGSAVIMHVCVCASLRINFVDRATQFDNVKKFHVHFLFPFIVSMCTHSFADGCTRLRRSRQLINSFSLSLKWFRSNF